jgi:branched-chain amino acid transport system ATP-binding protein
MLQLEGVSAGYGRVTVIAGLSLTVAAGEMLAVLGPNGAGKSTLVKAIAGAVPNRGGRIDMAGLALVNLPPHRIVAAGVALVPEGRHIFGPLTVLDNLRLGGMQLRREGARVQERLDYVFRLFPPLRERRHQRAGTMSGGEQQMLAIGRGLMSSPKLLLLDEPFLGLAPKVVEEILATITRLRGDGLTVVLVDQKIDMALGVSDRAAIMVNGAIVHEGPSARLRDEDLTRYYLVAQPSAES